MIETNAVDGPHVCFDGRGLSMWYPDPLQTVWHSFRRERMFYERATTMSERQVSFVFLWGKALKIRKFFGDCKISSVVSAWSKAAVFKWAKAFKDGRETVEN